MNVHRGLQVLVWLAAVLPCVPQVALAATLTLRLPSIEGRSGGTVDVPIAVAGASGVGAIQLEVVYDPAVISADTVTGGPLAGNALIDFNARNQGRLILGLATLQDITGDGVLAIARFKVVGNAGQSSALAIANGEAWEGKSHQAVSIRTEAGNLKVVGALPLWWLIGALIAVAVLGLLLLWFLLRRRRREVRQDASPAPMAAAPMATAPKATAPMAAAPVSPAVGAGVAPQRRGPFCSQCGSPNNAGARFCSSCGAPLAQIPA